MLVEEELARVSQDKDTLLTIGVFDGVHLGHRHLISRLREEARKRNLLTGVITFSQHPREVLNGETPPFLTSLTRRIELLKDEGVDFVAALSFTRGLAQLSAREFVSLLQKYLRMKGLIVGPDTTLGHGREANVSGLNRLGQEMGFIVTVVPPYVTNGEVVSSTAIRKALAEGDMARVRRLSGRDFSLSGLVVSGDGRGKTLGFPTANLEVDARQALPPDGVYVTWAYINGARYRSATNIGKRPTFGASQRTIEVYVFDYRNNLYGSELKIEIVERLRAEKKFDTVEELAAQIEEDVKKSKEILDALNRERR